ncbi:hypothetical protein [Paenibacillus sp. JCM 10914]|uniref:hypothetical protein n=1 Tax=Paenibacillus sp. JCM 10914 TaxID=1236974 RepID=UPI0005679720|nr:hypothetical protein [Paenibacillus sp. JCM 10914]
MAWLTDESGTDSLEYNEAGGVEGGINMKLHSRQKTSIPDGVMVCGQHPALYLVEDAMKRPIVDLETFQFYRFNPERIVKLDQDLLDNLDTGESICVHGDFMRSSPSTIVLQRNNSERYLWSGGKLHPIVSAETYQRLQFHLAQTVIVNDVVFNSLPMGEPIYNTAILAYGPINWRVYSAPDGRIYYSQQHRLHRILSPSIFYYYHWKSNEIIHLTNMEFSICSLGDPITEHLLPRG